MTDVLTLPVEDLPDALAALSEKERKALAPAVRDLHSREPGRQALLSLGCLGSAKQVVDALWGPWLGVEHEALAVRIVADRMPAWLPKLPAAITAEVQVGGWRLLRALVRAGLVERPDDPAYAIGMASGITFRYPEGPSVLDALRADPGLADEVWPMLRTEGAGQQLTYHDGFETDDGVRGSRPDRTWRHALVTLAAEGTLDRGRLLDTVLAAFLSDWSATGLGWYVGLYDALAPSDDELAERMATLARLLAGSYGPAVKLAQQAFRRLLAAGRLDADVLLAASPAVLQRPDKGTAMAQLTLLRDLAAARPDLAGAVADAARAALEHDRADVRERVRALMPDAAPAPPVVVVDTAPPPRAAPVPVVPAASADEVGELFAALMEEAGDPVAVERALDGVARFARQRPAGADALARRAMARRGELERQPWSGEEIRANLAQLVLVWLAGGSPGLGYGGRPTCGTAPRPDRSLGAVVAHRMHEVARVVANGGGPLLSLPTSSDGSLDPAALSERLARAGRLASPWPVDVAVAALRVPPSGHAAVAASGTSRTGRAVREALAALAPYAPEWERVVTRAGLMYRRDAAPCVAWRDRRQWKADGVLDVVLSRHDADAELNHDIDDGDFVSRYDQAVALWPLLLPHHPDLLAAHGHARLARGLVANRSASGALLDGLARTSEPAGPVVTSAVVLGLGVDNAADRMRAVDAFVDLASAGLLDGAAAGAQAALALADEVVVGQRLAASLADAARGGPAASAVVLDALVALLPVLPARRYAHAYVDLLAGLATAHGRTVALPDEFAALARGKASSALAAACRRVPAG